MGKTSSWLRSFLTAKKDKKETNPSNRNSPVLIPQPTSKERRRWSFRRSSASSKDKNSNPNQSNTGQFSASQIDNAKNTTMTIEDAAATRIQSAFRSYLARKALFALRGLVKLQALVRGHLVRKRATATLRCMQALMTAQARARARRLQMAADSKHRTPRHFFQGKYHLSETEKGTEENVKIVEIDLGYGANQQKGRTQGYFDGYYSSNTAQSSPKLHSPAPSRHHQSNPSPNFAAESQAAHGNPFYPNYMANTESSRAKTRSQSAPKTRPPDWIESQPSGRRVSLEGRHCPRPIRSMQRSCSQAGYGVENYENPWGIKLDKSSVSLKDSECGSTSTVLSSINYCRSLAAYDTHGNPSPWLFKLNP